jgi:isoquinoline 1-oxidoreductase beta subunit
MSEIIKLSRRDFLKTGAALGGGLVLGFVVPFSGREVDAATKATPVFVPNAWLRIGTDGTVTVLLHKCEMGQGIMTSLPMLVVEELDADWSKVAVEFAPADPAYFSLPMQEQMTGGSRAIRGSWDTLRKAGATARQMVITAAAQTWDVAVDTCRTESGEVIHQPSGRRLAYGALVKKAATLKVPTAVILKEPKAFRLIGTRTARVDTPHKVNGRAVFGIDVKVPDLLIARVLRCPVFGGKVARFAATKAQAVPGVRYVLQIDSGIAVVADGYWPAKLGIEALDVQWDEGPLAGLSSSGIAAMYQELAEQPGLVVRNDGDAAQSLAGAAKKLEAVYEVPYLAHATMEPMNCTAHVRKDGCDIWVPTQGQTRTQQTAAKITGLRPESIKVHTTLLGGGFGRRYEQDFVTEAVQISKAIGKPVKVIWSREDDLQHDFYRPATYNRFRAGLDAQGLPLVWTHRIVAPSILSRLWPHLVKDGKDVTSIEGAANLPYAIPNLHVDCITKEVGIPVGPWRSVGSSQNAFITECFLDELAAAGGKDPYDLRRQLLSKAPRHKAVLELAATKAGWGQPLPEGRFRGVAVQESFGSYVAEVAEVSVAADGNVRVHRVVCAVDCGLVVNPDTVEAQMEGAIVYGLTAALKGAITIDNGRVQQSNFHDYQMLRMNEMPMLEVHMLPSMETPGGVGEPGVPPIAPAVANAVFAATGKRVRKLPIRVQALQNA